jgi:hypothetical protein
LPFSLRHFHDPAECLPWCWCICRFSWIKCECGPIGNQQMARYLRGEAKRRFVAEWQYIPTTEIHKIKAVDYVKLDPQVKICKD